MASDIFASRIKTLRESKGISIRRLAEDLGIGFSTISQYENCKRVPDIYVCKKFADYFNVSGDYLIGITDDPYRKE